MACWASVQDKQEGGTSPQDDSVRLHWTVGIHVLTLLELEVALLKRCLLIY